MKTAKISSKNQITLPAAALTRLGLKAGARVLVEPLNSGLLLRPLRRSVVEDLYGYAQETWRKLGGGAAYLKKERKQWKRESRFSKHS